jgi:hypothetical protein
MKNRVNRKYEPNITLSWLNKTSNWPSKYVVTLLLVFLFASCSSMPFSEKKQLTALGTEPSTGKTASVEELAPEPGNIKVIEGIEYIYASNRRYMFTPYEPLYVWIKKDEYTPRMGENLLTRNTEETEHFKRLEERIKKLEEELKKMGNS